MNPLTLAESPTEEMAQLRERIHALELRLDRLEQGGAAPVAAPEPIPAPVALAAPAPLDTEIAAATLFKRAAMLCFVLLGALILRVLTQQNLLGPRFGTLLGFAYAGHLIVLSLVPGRFGGFARESSLFPCSGVVLAFIIALESALRTLTLGRVWALLAIAGFALLALAMGIYQRKAVLGATGVLGAILAVVALDLTQSTLALQLAIFVVLAGAGIAASWQEGWPWLRPLTTLAAAVLLPAGFFFCGKEPGVPSGLLAAAAGVWGVLVLQHLIAFRRLQGAAAWLPLMTLWLAGIQHLAHWHALGSTASAIAGVALAAVFLGARRAREATAGIAGLVVTTAIAGTLGWTRLDPTGLLCTLGGLALWFAGRRAARDWAAAAALVLLLAAAAVSLMQLLRPPLAIGGLLGMALSALLMVLHYVRNGRVGAEPYSGLPMRLAPVALAAGLALLLGLFWELLNRLFQQPAPLLLSQTVVVVVTSLGLTSWGHLAHRRSALFCGLACMALALAKVLLIDLMQLRSLNMLASLILAGLACVAVSVILRRQREDNRPEQART